MFLPWLTCTNSHRTPPREYSLRCRSNAFITTWTRPARTQGYASTVCWTDNRISLFFCARFANGNLRLSGHEHAADLDELNIIRRFTGKVSPNALDGMRRYVVRQRKLPTLHVQRPSGTHVIALSKYAHSNIGTITLTANGTSLRLKIDTGSSGITLDATWARKLGVRMINRSTTGRGPVSHNIHARHGVLDQVSLGGITVKNAPVIVIPGRHRLIGMDILRHLGAFRLGKHEFTVYGPNAKRPVCRQPMLVGSDVWGHKIHVVTALSVNGTLHTVLVDSGTSFYFSGSRAAMHELKSGRNGRLAIHDMGSGKHHTRVNRATAVITVAGQPIRIAMPIFKDVRLPWNYIIGSGALRDMDFYFDFDNHHVCMLVHDHLY